MRNPNLLRIRRHRQTRMTLSTRLEWRSLRTHQRRNLPTPAIPQDPPTLDLRILLLHTLQQGFNKRHRLSGLGWPCHEIRDSLELRWRLGRVVCDVGWVVAEEDGHEDLEVAGVVGLGGEVGGEDVGAAD